MYIIETKDITKKYGKYQVLNKLNIHVKENSIYGLIGKNGAGKTTLIRIICGLQDPTNGTYFINKIDNKAKDISLVRKKIGAIIERPSIYEEMNAKDNIICQMKLVGLTNYQDISKFLDVVGLSNVGNKKVRYYSLGMKQRLGIALALVNNPNILILDEPINGLDPEGIIEIRELILKLNKEKHITILISSHYLDELSKVATHYGFIDKGRIIEEISSEELNKKLTSFIELKVNNLKSFTDFFKKNNIPYEIKDNNIINIYKDYNIQKFITELTNNNLEIESITKKNESLEEYYINLIGGNNND